MSLNFWPVLALTSAALFILLTMHLSCLDLNPWEKVHNG